MKQAENFVQVTGEHRLGYPRQAARLEDAGDFAQGRVHVFHRHVVQGLEHQHDVEAVVGRRDGFGPAAAELHVRQVADLQVALVLDVIDFERDDFLQPAGFGQHAGLFGLAAAQFEHAGAVERQFGEHEPDFIDQRVLGGIGDFHGVASGLFETSNINRW